MFQRRGRRWLPVAGVALLAIALAHPWAMRRRPIGPTPIYRGVTYQCLRLPETAQSGGLAHVVSVDLDAEGIELFLTPAEAGTVPPTWRLNYAARAVREHGLAAAVNGTLFAAESGWLPMRGDPARPSETVVVNGAASHIDPNSFLVWFDSRRTPRVENRPPPPHAVAAAVVGIGGQERVLIDGRPRPGTQTLPDRRTLLAFNASTRTLYLAVFERASYHAAAEVIAGLGATDGIMLDGGSSSAMALGPEARNVRGGRVFGDRRPVANHFGVKAMPLP